MLQAAREGRLPWKDVLEEQRRNPAKTKPIANSRYMLEPSTQSWRNLSK
jgi:hypothetical protein